MVPSPLRICSNHFRLVPRTQQDALAHYARHYKGGPAHQAAFDRAVESINKVIAWGRATVAADKPVSLPYRDD